MVYLWIGNYLTSMGKSGYLIYVYYDIIIINME